MFPIFSARRRRHADPAEALASGDYDAALAIYEERLRSDPDNAGHWRRKFAECLLAAGRRNEAVQAYLIAAADLERQGLSLQAIAVLTAVRRIDPQNPAAAEQLGELAAQPAQASAPAEPRADDKLTIRTRLRSYAPLFSEFDREELTRILEITRLHRFPAGRSIFRQGDPGDSLFVVVQGRITLTVDGVDGEPVVIESIRDGGCFGEVSALSRVPRNVTATATLPTEVLELSRDYLEAVAIAHPRIWQVLDAFQRSRIIPAGA